jgi:hypothetical protein
MVGGSSAPPGARGRDCTNWKSYEQLTTICRDRVAPEKPHTLAAFPAIFIRAFCEGAKCWMMILVFGGCAMNSL